ncbi:hypothetical protein [Nocardia sp. NPDC060249]|uniref:hypothetical protein n=1 Tax=Nocardia sp. NPDC060249 TaxID=3347082 RepID=UPI0036633294
MTDYPQYRARPATVEAVQFIHGASTRTDMLAFCPKANIGSPWEDTDDTDIRWFFVPCRGDGEVRDGDWILRATDGTYTVCREDDFARRYEHIARTDPQMTEADRMACEWSDYRKDCADGLDPNTFRHVHEAFKAGWEAANGKTFEPGVLR